MRRRTSGEDASGLVVFGSVFFCDVLFDVERFFFTLSPLELCLIPLQVRMIDVAEELPVVQGLCRATILWGCILYVEEPEITSIGLVESDVDFLELVDFILGILATCVRAKVTDPRSERRRIVFLSIVRTVERQNNTATMTA